MAAGGCRFADDKGEGIDILVRIQLPSAGDWRLENSNVCSPRHRPDAIEARSSGGLPAKPRQKKIKTKTE